MIARNQLSSRYIINLAHGLTPEHKPDKVKVFVDEVAKASEKAYAE
jgi:uroporphyrinogen-III decarboxylase